MQTGPEQEAVLLLCKLQHSGFVEKLSAEVLSVKLVTGGACRKIVKIPQRSLQPPFLKTLAGRL